MEDFFIARQPIFNCEGGIVGFEILFRRDANAQTADFESDEEAGTSVLMGILSNFGQEWLLGEKTAFINVAESMLQSEFIELLDSTKTVFEITPATKMSDALVEKVEELKGDGFRFLLDDCAIDERMLPLVSTCEYAKIDCQRTGMLGMLDEIKRIREKPGMRHIKIIASKIETGNEKQQAIDAGVDFFQGYFFQKPETLKSKTLTPREAVLVRIISLVKAEAPTKKIEDAFKHDVAASLKLLRYINSAGFGLRCEITSFGHAIQMLGYKKLNRWLLLLLATSNSDAPPELAQTAIARGRFMELVAADTMSQEDKDNLFVTGAFSYLDALLGVDMQDIIPTLGLNDDVNDALINQTGPYYPFLMLAIATERAMQDTQRMRARELGITSETANGALFESIKWANAMLVEQDIGT